MITKTVDGHGKPFKNLEQPAWADNRPDHEKTRPGHTCRPDELLDALAEGRAMIVYSIRARKKKLAQRQVPQ